MKKAIFEVVHESAKDLHDIGLVNKKTMHTFDALCLPQVPLSPSTKTIKHCGKKALVALV